MESSVDLEGHDEGRLGIRIASFLVIRSRLGGLVALQPLPRNSHGPAAPAWFHGWGS